MVRIVRLFGLIIGTYLLFVVVSTFYNYYDTFVFILSVKIFWIVPLRVHTCNLKT